MDSTFDRYLKIMCQTTDTTKNELLGKCKDRTLCSYRFLLWYYLHKYFDYGCSKLGKYFNRNHATIIHGMKCAEDYLHIPCFRKEKLRYMEFLINVSLNKNK